MQTESYFENFQLGRLFEENEPADRNDQWRAVDPKVLQPYEPKWKDLECLHNLVISRMVTTVLEFGVGHSTKVMADALSRNSKLHASYVRENLRRSDAFQLHSVDDMPEFIALTKESIPAELKSTVKINHSNVKMGEFNGRICTFYENLPNVCPDLIYLDGPSQHSVKGDVRGISTRHADRLPMAGDILAMEYFLLPGTLIVVDGRAANYRFLQNNLQRNWVATEFHEDFFGLELVESPIGELNRKQIEFCLGQAWLEGHGF